MERTYTFAMVVFLDIALGAISKGVTADGFITDCDRNAASYVSKMDERPAFPNLYRQRLS